MKVVSSPLDRIVLLRARKMLKKVLWKVYHGVYRNLFPPPPESLRKVVRKLFVPVMYREYLFEELLVLTPQKQYNRILEIGPKDGLDSKSLASLDPKELVMIDLPEKHEGNVKWLSEMSCPYKYIETNFMGSSLFGVGNLPPGTTSCGRQDAQAAGFVDQPSSILCQRCCPTRCLLLRILS